MPYAYPYVLQCPIRRPFHALHGLTVLDDMRQSNGCLTPAPRSSAAKQWLEQLAQRRIATLHWSLPSTKVALENEDGHLLATRTATGFSAKITRFTEEIH